MLSMKVVRRVNPKSFHHKERNFFFSVSFILYLCKMTDVHETYCGNHFILLYTLNLQSAVCQLYFNKTGRNNKIKIRKTTAELRQEGRGQVTTFTRMT